MNKMILLAAAAAAMLGGCTSMGYDDGYGYNRYVSNDAGDWGYYDRSYSQRYGRYDWDRPDPSYNGYYADRYYRSSPRYRERVLRNDDRVYRGRDGRYYCRRSDGTTGLVVGGVAGGALGALIAEGDSKPLGAIIGALGGAAAGAAIDSGGNGVRCR